VPILIVIIEYSLGVYILKSDYNIYKEGIGYVEDWNKDFI
jgi:hypothetical protein